MWTAPYDIAGILVIGDFYSALQSVEFWSSTDPEQESCVLKDYPRGMQSPTVNLVSGRLVACNGLTCEIYQEGLWQHLQNTMEYRAYHSSAATEGAVLLIGGDFSNGSTEWIPVDGSPPHQGPFIVRHGQWHCTMQMSDDIIVVAGGLYTYNYVTQYDLADGSETTLTSLGRPRYKHACGVYQDTGGQQVKVKGFAAMYNQCALWHG